LSHAFSLFCSGYFGDGGLSIYLSELALNLSLPILVSKYQVYRHKNHVWPLF
jgi:hypothetical protein